MVAFRLPSVISWGLIWATILCCLRFWGKMSIDAFSPLTTASSAAKTSAYPSSSSRPSHYCFHHGHSSNYRSQLLLWSEKSYVAKETQKKDTGKHKTPSSNIDKKQPNSANDKSTSPKRKTKRRRTWEENFQLLKAYKSKHGDCNVPQRYEKDKTLGNWVFNQRQYGRKGILPDKKIAQLDTIGFMWENVIEKVNDGKWNVMYEKLEAYKSKNGDCNVPKVYEKDKKLGNWVFTQRRFRRKGILPDEKIAQLDAIGFMWENVTEQVNDDKWNVMYEQKQPSSANNKATSPKRKTKCRRTWEENFQLLKAYKSKHGDCNVPQKYEKDKTLGNWVFNQRQSQRMGILPEEKIAQLDTIGFMWGKCNRKSE
jgi:ribosomal protein L28